MKTTARTALLNPLALLLVALSLSVGWGIRGNYGHEIGAMFPGALAAVAACLASGRADWHSRVAYFGLFGMLGWAFGGSMSYMMVIGYTHSGHSATQAFGFYALFAIGFLWAALGGAGTALPAVMNDKQLRAIFVPLSVLLGTWGVLYFALTPATNFLQDWFEMGGIAAPMRRQERALYWLDSDWVQVSVILAVLLVFDLVTRRFENGWALFAMAAGGGLVSYLLFLVLHMTAGNGWIVSLFVQPQGMFEDRFTTDQLAVTNWPRLFLYLGNRDGLFYPGESLALWGGALLGIGAYFARFGRFSHGSGLFVAMAVGWLTAFVMLPVIGSLFLGQYGGLRMTPPRGDNWAGVLGTLIGALIYCWRHDLRAIVVAALVCGTVGGIAFSGVAWLEGFLVSLGNRNLTASPELWTAWQEAAWEPETWTSGQRMPPPEFLGALPSPEGWQAWQTQNWHSFLEQSYGFVNGLGLAVMLAVLAARLPSQDSRRPGKPWMLLMSLIFVFPVLAFTNIIKNLRPWTQVYNGHRSMPDAMAIPWTAIELSTGMWFNVFSLLALLTLVALFFAHRRRPVPIVPASWIGCGQLLFVAILWTFIVGNFTRALPAFAEGRMVTEGIIYINALLATLLVLVVPVARPHTSSGEPSKLRRSAVSSDPAPRMETSAEIGGVSIEPEASIESVPALDPAKPPDMPSPLESERETPPKKQVVFRPSDPMNRWVWIAGVSLVVAMLAVPAIEWWSARRIYGDAHTGKRGMDFRLGPNANWKRAPLLKGELHR